MIPSVQMTNSRFESGEVVILPGKMHLYPFLGGIVWWDPTEHSADGRISISGNATSLPLPCSGGQDLWLQLEGKGGKWQSTDRSPSVPGNAV